MKYGFALLVMFAGLPCAAQNQSASIRTGVSVNGRYWQALSDPSKLAWLMAFDEGVTCGIIDSGRLRDIAALEGIYFAGGMSYGETRKGIDQFYNQVENLPFKVDQALRLFAMKVNGIPQSDIDAKLAAFRYQNKSQVPPPAAEPPKANRQ